MEFRETLQSKTAVKHRPLTPLRVLRGLLCLLVLFSTSFTMLVYFAPVIAVLLRLFSIHYSRKAVDFVFGSWLALWPFLFEKINKTKMVFAGDKLPPRERVLLMANHRTEVDWMYLWDLGLRKGCIGSIKYIMKSSILKVPVYGCVLHVAEFIAVTRKWEVDESIIHKMLLSFSDPRDSLWLAVFPEGTDFSEQKCVRSQNYAAEKGLPVMKNVLLPKTKGFYACLKILRSSLDAVYDVTIGYKHNCPNFMDNIFGVDPSEVHLHVQRIPLNEIPTLENEASAWLIDRFHLKDQLLSEFIAHGHFPNERTEKDLSTLKCLTNFAIVIALTALCVFLTFSSRWLAIYAALSFACLTSATYLNFRPSPIGGFLSSIFHSKKDE